MNKLLMATAAVVAMAGTAQAEECLQYGKTVTLSGTMSMHKANFRNVVPWRDFRYAVLTLDTPICAAGDDEETERGVRNLHVFEEEKCDHRTWPRGAKAQISGVLWHANTVAHQTPVLITPQQGQVRRLNGPTPTCKG
jgi:hypothetical protein